MFTFKKLLVGLGLLSISAITSANTGFCAGKLDGYYANPVNPTTFYQCFNELTYLNQCPVGLVFDSSSNTCTWA
ncbi:membrane protein [Aliivibrio wodanis]|uniref:Membrane protein n=1 Tax=Aliivibrio wodanis TaxID=80852 RepID=A0A090IQ12_9GAMM|nr:membrane protein [Aliivibrio wodanis]